MARIPTTSEINAWVSAGAAESMTLEFKAQPWGNNDEAKRECLKDITALANTRGGLIVVGIAESNNAASALSPLSAEDAEKERGRINDLIAGGVEPRLYGVDVEAVPVDGGAVLAIAVPRSASRPHRITARGHNRYWLRNSTGVYEANVADLRALFLQSAEIGERALRWHDERRAAIRAGHVVSNIAPDPDAMVLHLIPADAFAPQATQLDLKVLHGNARQFWPIGATGFNPQYTFDGFLAVPGTDPCSTYTLVQRNGIVEAIEIGLRGGQHNLIYPARLEQDLVDATNRYAASLFSLGIVPPVYVVATIEGVQGAEFARRHYSVSIPQEKLALPVVVVESAASEQEIASALRPALDALYNAAGFVGSPSFNEEGEYVSKV
ncbi:MAG: hypothetical protein BroJett013_22970 [Alphaproteobacteria bacterium]|nr:MAG: hypothetical protein BroJett013_22970 [Alphaproteobacteria bacterium]